MNFLHLLQFDSVDSVLHSHVHIFITGMLFSMSLVLSATMAIGCSLSHKDLSWYLLIIELLIILTICHEFVSSSDVEFVAHPGDLSVIEGESGTFNCTLKSRLPFSVAMSYWENGLTEPISMRGPYNVTTTSDNISRTISSYLTISNVRRDMNKLYKCRIMLEVADDSRIAVSSEFANLDVLYFLKDYELHCRGPTDHILREYHQITIECESTKTKPKAVLRWLEPLSVFSSFSQTRSLLVGNITVTTSLHNNLLTCVAESEAFPGEAVNCSLGPYTIIHSPIVEVVPNQGEMIWPSVTQMQFKCIASGYPRIKEYKWFCNPRELFAQCQSYSPNLTIILDTFQGDETVNISCEATNDVATSRNSSIVNVRYEARLDVCKSNSTYLPGMTENGLPVLLYDDKKGTLKCLTEVDSIKEKVKFKWYLDGHLVAENNGDHGFIKSKGSSHLFIYSLLKVYKQGIAACNVLYTSSNSFSLEHLVTCNLSSVDVEDPMASITDSWESTSMEDNESYSVGQSGYSNEILIAVPLAIGCGILFCIVLVLIILASRRLVGGRTIDTHTSGTAIQLSDFKGIPSHMNGSTSSDHDGDLPVYEVPDVDFGRSTINKNRSHFGPGRRLNLDRYLEEEGGEEEEEEEGERGGDGRGGGRLGREYFSDNTDESKKSDSNSCCENQDMSFLSDETYEKELPGFYSDYENCEVVDSVVGNTKSKYFMAKMAKSGK